MTLSFGLQSSTSRRIHSLKRVPAGGDWYGTCHDERFFDGTIPIQPAGGGQPIHGVRDGDGGVIFSLAPGEYDWLTVPGHSLDGGAFYCANTAAPAVEIPAFPLSLDAGECADLGDVVAGLTAIAFLEGEPAGAVDGLPVETSFTRLDLPLEDILATHHVIAVRAGPAGPEEDAVVACGAVGGTVTGDGTVAIGLRAVDDYSGLSGIAYLAPDGEQTLVTIFLAWGLSSVQAPPEADT